MPAIQTGKPSATASGRSSAWSGVREWRRRCLTRLQLFWLVHLASQPHTLTSKPAMVVAPHQDDEVLGCGGLIALKRQSGVPVHIVFLTDGSASHADNKGRDPRLAEQRRQEALQAAEILGVPASAVHFLDQPDGELRMLEQAQREATLHALANLLIQCQPQELYVPHRHDRTEDHEACYELVLASVRESHARVDVFQYAVWMLWSSLVFRDYSRAELEGVRCLRIHAVQRLKAQALQAHRSQWLPRAEGEPPVLEPSFLARFSLPNELFFKPELSAKPVSRLPPL